MRKVFNEKKEIENLLKYGFVSGGHVVSSAITRDPDNYKRGLSWEYSNAKVPLTLLIKYFRNEKMPPRKIKEKLIELWLNYDENYDYKIINRMLKTIGPGEYTFVEVDTITISRDEMAWFNDPGLSVAQQKILFTLYCWAKIQKNYRTKSWDIVSLEGSMKRLKENTGITTIPKIVDEMGIVLRTYHCIEWLLAEWHPEVLGHYWKERYEEAERTGNSDIYLIKKINAYDQMRNWKLYYAEDVWKLSKEYVDTLEEGWYTDASGEINDKANMVVYNLDVNTTLFGKWYETQLAKVDKDNMDIGIISIRKQVATCPECGKPFEGNSHRVDQVCPRCYATTIKSRNQRIWRRRNAIEKYENILRDMSEHKAKYVDEMGIKKYNAKFEEYTVKVEQFKEGLEKDLKDKNERTDKYKQFYYDEYEKIRSKQISEDTERYVKKDAYGLSAKRYYDESESDNIIEEFEDEDYVDDEFDDEDEE